MKKIVKKIALILILVMLVNSFSSCATTYKDSAGEEHSTEGLWIVGGVIVGIGLAIYLVFYGIGWLIEEAISSAEINMDSNIEICISELENEPFKETLYSLLETEEIPIMETLSLLSEAELISLKNQYYSIPELEHISTINTLNSLSENTMLDLLQKIEVGVGLDNSVYLGVRLQY